MVKKVIKQIIKKITYLPYAALTCLLKCRDLLVIIIRNTNFKKQAHVSRLAVHCCHNIVKQKINNVFFPRVIGRIVYVIRQCS